MTTRAKHLKPSDSKRLRAVDDLPLVLPNQMRLPGVTLEAAIVASANRAAVNPEHIGKRLRSARQAVGYTQQNVAERSGLKRESVARAEAGGSHQSLDTIARIATACGVHVAEILEVDDEECV